MGAEQSRADNQRGERPAGQTKTCYYELLEVERSATDDEIKKAYRRKALRLHPDRNLGDVDNATKQFAEIQSAYEILSDPQERAWYDSHRETILRGDDDLGPDDHVGQESRFTSASDLVRLISKFRSDVAFTDDQNGFYGLLRATFAKLTDEETEAYDIEGHQAPDYPEFGHAGDSHETTVRSFYNFWLGFGTRKSFAWRDVYRLSDAPDRRVRRLMEKENKRLRDEGIREFNDAVRSLAAFARKRDPRCRATAQSDADRQKILQDAAAAQAARSRAANLARLEEQQIPLWAQTPQQQQTNDALVGSFSESEESEEEQFECVVCAKIFKSEKQYEAHEKSKKHVKAVQQLKREMRKENVLLDLDKAVEAEEALDPPNASDADVIEEQVKIEHDAANKQKSSKNGRQTPLDSSLESERTSAIDDDITAPPNDENHDDGSSTDESTAETPEEKSRTGAPSVGSPIGDLTSETAATHNQSGNETSPPPVKIGKAKAKRARKAAQQSAEAQATDQHKCATCGQGFDSNTKLFGHIKAQGHAKAVDKTNRKGIKA